MKRRKILGRERTLGIGNFSAREIPYCLEKTVEGEILLKVKYPEDVNIRNRKGSM